MIYNKEKQQEKVYLRALKFDSKAKEGKAELTNGNTLEISADNVFEFIKTLSDFLKQAGKDEQT